MLLLLLLLLLLPPPPLPPLPPLVLAPCNTCACTWPSMPLQERNTTLPRAPCPLPPPTPPTLHARAGDWRVGAKAAYELFPAGLKHRLQRERKKRWAERQRGAVAEAVAAAAAFSKAHPSPVRDEELRRLGEELEARVKLLAELDEKYEDQGVHLNGLVLLQLAGADGGRQGAGGGAGAQQHRCSRALLPSLRARTAWAAAGVGTAAPVWHPLPFCTPLPTLPACAPTHRTRCRRLPSACRPHAGLRGVARRRPLAGSAGHLGWVCSGGNGAQRVACRVQAGGWVCRWQGQGDGQRRWHGM